MDVKKNRRWLLFVKIYSALSEFMVLCRHFSGIYCTRYKEKEVFSMPRRA